MQYPSLTINTQAGSGLTGGGVVPLGNALALSVDPTVVPMLAASNIFSGGTNTFGGYLFVGSGTPTSLPLEIRAGGSSSTNDAITVDSQGNVAVGAGTGSHITTASGNSDFAGSGVSIPSSGQSSTPQPQPSGQFATPFASAPACTVTPYVAPGAALPTAGIPAWYITYGTTTQGNSTVYSSFTINLVSPNPNSTSITFSYMCVGNPN